MEAALPHVDCIRGEILRWLPVSGLTVPHDRGHLRHFTAVSETVRRGRLRLRSCSRHAELAVPVSAGVLPRRLRAPVSRSLVWRRLIALASRSAERRLLAGLRQAVVICVRRPVSALALSALAGVARLVRARPQKRFRDFPRWERASVRTTSKMPHRDLCSSRKTASPARCTPPRP